MDQSWSEPYVADDVRAMTRMRQRTKGKLIGSGRKEEDGCSTQMMTPLVACHGPSILSKWSRGLSRDRKGDSESESSAVNCLLLFFRFYRLKKSLGWLSNSHGHRNYSHAMPPMTPSRVGFPSVTNHASEGKTSRRTLQLARMIRNQQDRS